MPARLNEHMKWRSKMGVSSNIRRWALATFALGALSLTAAACNTTGSLDDVRSPPRSEWASHLEDVRSPPPSEWASHLEDVRSPLVTEWA
jgi:predicted small secreted protein